MTIDDLLIKIKSFKKLKKNWNNYGAKKFKKSDLIFYQKVTSNLIFAPTSCTPTSQNGILLEFKDNGIILNIHLMKDFVDCKLLTKNNGTVSLIAFDSFSCIKSKTKTNLVVYLKKFEFSKIINSYISIFENIVKIYG